MENKLLLLRSKNIVKKMQLQYLELQYFIGEISTRLNDCYDSDIEGFTNDGLQELAKMIASQIDGYRISSFDMLYFNDSVNNICDVVENNEALLIKQE